MKIGSPVSPRQAAPDGAHGHPRGLKSWATSPTPGALDTVQISPEASAIRSATETRARIAHENRAAVVAQPVDVKRLQGLLQSVGTRVDRP